MLMFNSTWAIHDHGDNSGREIFSTCYWFYRVQFKNAFIKHWAYRKVVEGHVAGHGRRT